MCENCINKEVCKWYEYMTEQENYIDNIDNNSPIVLKIECKKRRVKNA